MLTRLKALTNNFTCQSCWQVLTFARFFDDDHECLKKVGDPHHESGHHELQTNNRIGRSNWLPIPVSRFHDNPVAQENTHS